MRRVLRRILEWRRARIFPDNSTSELWRFFDHATKGSPPQDAEVTRISIARWRGAYPTGEDRAEYAWLVELGGFHAPGACGVDEVLRRYGPGNYRVTAYGFDPPGVRWEVLIENLT